MATKFKTNSSGRRLSADRLDRLQTRVILEDGRIKSVLLLLGKSQMEQDSYN